MYISLTDIHQMSSLKEKEFPAMKNNSCMGKFLWQWCTSRNRNPLTDNLCLISCKDSRNSY